MANTSTIVCTNVYKHTEKEQFEKIYTQKWIELINQYEKKSKMFSQHKEV